jgi:hypothetical protein
MDGSNHESNSYDKAERVSRNVTVMEQEMYFWRSETTR